MLETRWTHDARANNTMVGPRARRGAPRLWHAHRLAARRNARRLFRSYSHVCLAAAKGASWAERHRRSLRAAAVEHAHAARRFLAGERAHAGRRPTCIR